MRPDQWVRVVAYLVAALPNVGATGATWDVYGQELADLEYADVMAAARESVRTHRWLPTIAELRESARELRRIRGARQDVAAVAALPEHGSSTPESAAEAAAARRRAADLIAALAESLRMPVPVYLPPAKRPWTKTPEDAPRGGTRASGTGYRPPGPRRGGKGGRKR